MEVQKKYFAPPFLSGSRPQIEADLKQNDRAHMEMAFHIMLLYVYTIHKRIKDMKPETSKIDFVSDYIQSKTNSFYRELSNACDQISSDCSKRGVYASSPFPQMLMAKLDRLFTSFFTGVLHAVFDELDRSCKLCTHSEFEAIANLLKNRAAGIIRQARDDVIFKYYTQNRFDDLIISACEQTEIHIKTDITKYIQTKESGLHIRKDAPALKAAKAANIIAIIAIILSLAAILLNLLKK